MGAPSHRTTVKLALTAEASSSANVLERLAGSVAHAPSRTARRELVSTLAAGFERVGSLLRAHGHIIGDGRPNETSVFGNGDDRVVALGYLAHAALALISGASELLRAGNNYSAAALTRQLVEVEYLLWAFADDEDEAASWLRSSKEDRLKYWQPRHLRGRSSGRFKPSAYGHHCELGGHPTPDGMRYFLGSAASHQAHQVELTWNELAGHGTGSWRCLLSAVSHLELAQLVPQELSQQIGLMMERWERADSIVQAFREDPTRPREK